MTDTSSDTLDIQLKQYVDKFRENIPDVTFQHTNNYLPVSFK
jgi:hypothetical protein